MSNYPDEISKADEDKDASTPLLACRRTRDEFKRLYQCEFTPCPIISECVAFLRWATPKDVTRYNREGLFTGTQIRAARRIIEMESDT